MNSSYTSIKNKQRKNIRLKIKIITHCKIKMKKRVILAQIRIQTRRKMKKNNKMALKTFKRVDIKLSNLEMSQKTMNRKMRHLSYKMKNLTLSQISMREKRVNSKNKRIFFIKVSKIYKIHTQFSGIKKTGMR